MNTGGAGAMTHQRHVAGVAPEAPDVLLNPVERRNLIQDAEVGRVLQTIIGIGI